MLYKCFIQKKGHCSLGSYGDCEKLKTISIRRISGEIIRLFVDTLIEKSLDFSDAATNSIPNFTDFISTSPLTIDRTLSFEKSCQVSVTCLS